MVASEDFAARIEFLTLERKLLEAGKIVVEHGDKGRQALVRRIEEINSEIAHCFGQSALQARQAARASLVYSRRCQDVAKISGPVVDEPETPYCARVRSRDLNSSKRA